MLATMKFKPLWLVPAFIWACGSGSDKIVNADLSDTSIRSTGAYAAEAPVPLPAMPACYLYTSGSDSTLLRLQSLTPDGETAGELEYRIKEKESSQGAFWGKLKGDTLLANYSYLQKGKRKVKEVIFIRKGEKWVEGTGAFTEREGIRRFDNPATMDYSKLVFQKVNCL